MSLSDEQIMMEAQRRHKICLAGAIRQKEEIMAVLCDEYYEPYRQFVKKQRKEQNQRMMENIDAQNTLNSLPIREQEIIKEVLKKLDEDNHKNNTYNYY